MNDFVDENSSRRADVLRPASGPGFANDSTRIITARGTEDGLVLRIDGRAEWAEIIADLELFLGDRRKFLEGGEVSLEWLDRLPTKEQSKELEVFFKERYGIEIVARRRRDFRTYSSTDTGSAKDSGANRDMTGRDMKGLSRDSKKASVTTIPLFDAMDEPRAGGADATLRAGIEKVSMSPEFSGELRPENYGAEAMISLGTEDERASELGRKYVNRMAKVLGEDVFYEDDANAKVIFGTLRSGQRVETPFSLIVVGDVNPGADLIAGGDILVFGSLRGTAHASAYDDESQERIILALHMQPMQLRIGSVISRGSDETVSGAEIARIEDRRIIVEAFNARAFLGKKVR